MYCSIHSIDLSFLSMYIYILLSEMGYICEIPLKWSLYDIGSHDDLIYERSNLKWLPIKFIVIFFFLDSRLAKCELIAGHKEISQNSSGLVHVPCIVISHRNLLWIKLPFLSLHALNTTFITPSITWGITILVLVLEAQIVLERLARVVRVAVQGEVTGEGELAEITKVVVAVAK